MFETLEAVLSYELFSQEFNNHKNGIKKSFNREELLSVQLLEFVRELNREKPLKKIDCIFDTKSHIIRRWNDMIDNMAVMESAPVLALIFNPILSFCFEDNETPIGAFEQFMSIITSGVIDHKMITFEYSDESKLFVGFCLNGWVPNLMTYDFKLDEYLNLKFFLVNI